MATDRRIYRLSQAIHNRQQDIIIGLDHIHDQHNISAVIRSADAAGFGKIIWMPDYKKPEKVNPEVSKGSEKWVKLTVTDDLKENLTELKKQGYKVAATHMGRKAVDFRTIDWTTPWVVVFGNEQRGCSDDIVELADANIFLPMMGFVQSLNISVAAAVTLYEIQRQRAEKGMYSKNASHEQIEALYEQWKLKEDKLSIESLYERIIGEIPKEETPHQDGRLVCNFSKKKKET